MLDQASCMTRSARSALRPESEQSGAMVETISEMFGRVLRFSPIEPDSDFFELGGDSIMATTLALEVEAEFGVRLPVSILFDASTPAMLAGAIANLETAGGTRLVRLRAGTEVSSTRASVFLIPGAGGSAMAVSPFARQLDVPLAVYGLLAPGLDGKQPTASRVEHLVGHHLASIRSVQPHGPYFLGGYSMGGFTALELARALIAAGEEVALLVLFDTYISPPGLPWAIKFAVWRRRVAHHVRTLKDISPRAVLPFVLARGRSLLSDLGIARRPPPGMPSPGDIRLTPAMRRVAEAGMAAAAAYRPKFYPGTITYFEARSSDAMPGYPELTWRRLARKLVIHLVDGDHWDMLSARGADSARQFSQCVLNALAPSAKDTPPARPDRPQR